MSKTKNPSSRAKETAGGRSSRGAEQAGYTAADSLVWLEGLEGVRKRAGMYIGATDSRGLTHCVFEILDNAVDEALAGWAKRLVVSAHTDGSFSVRDDGRGIPVDIEPKSKLSGVVLVMTKLHAGGKFGGSGYKVAGGLHGVGASVVNALSARLDVGIERDGAAWEISFQRGKPGKFAGSGPAAGFKPDPGPRKTGRAAKRHGTVVRFWPDEEIFQPGSEVEWEKVVERCRTTAHLVPGLRIEVHDERSGENTVFHAPEGLVALVAAELGETAASPVWRCTGTRSFKQKAQVVGEDGLVAAEVEREIEVDVALGWSNGFDTGVRGFVNVVATPGGGTHVTGFERAVLKAVQGALAGTKLLRAGEELPVRDDVLEGLVAAVSVRVPEPEFEGQTKEVLSTPEAAKAVAEVVAEGLEPLFGAQRLRPAVRSVCEKVVAAGRARRAARDRRDTARKQRAIASGPLPAKLRDCRSHDGRSELYIVEGDSAAGSVGAARDSLYQAYLPIRGKILNTARVSDRAILENAECASLLAAIGAGAGTNFDLGKVRYEKLVLLVDADVDGSHIRSLLLTLCYRAMRPLLESGRVYAAAPPLYRLTLSDGSHLHCYSEVEKDKVLADLERRKVKLRDGIQRFKGLGEMSATEIGESALDPATRRWRQISMDDAARADAMFTLLMGDDSGARRDWLLRRAEDADLDAIDV
jgi:DNA gyrase subunit B